MYFFFNDTATTEIYTLSLHDALPISEEFLRSGQHRETACLIADIRMPGMSGLELQAKLNAEHCRIPTDRKSTRLNSSHGYISYAVFCLKKKKKNKTDTTTSETVDTVR